MDARQANILVGESAAVVAAVLTALWVLNWEQGWITRDTFDFLLPPGQRLFASGNAFLDDIRCYCQRSNSRHRTPRSPCAHPPAAVALTCTITHSDGLSRTIVAPTVGH